MVAPSVEVTREMAVVAVATTGQGCAADLGVAARWVGAWGKFRHANDFN